MFLSRNKTNNVYPCEPQFYYIKVWFKGVKITYVCFRDVLDLPLLHMKPLKQEQSRTETGTVGRKNTGGLNQFNSRETSSLSPDAVMSDLLLI